MNTHVQEKRWHYFLMVACGVLLSTMDSSMINVALPAIMRDFHLPLVQVELVVLIYLMVITFSLVFWGRLADQVGKGRIFVSGMAVFTIGSLLCGISGSFSSLVWSRGVQAFGAAMMMSAGPAIIKFTCPPEHLGKTLGLVGVATSCGLMGGPAVSGYMLSHFSWRSIFLVNLPLGVLICLLGGIFLLPPLNKAELRRKICFDWTGGMLWIVLVIAYVGLLKLMPTHTLPVVGLGAVVFVVALYLFFKVEAQASDPIMPVSLVRKRYYWTAVATVAISFSALFVILIIMPFYLDYGLKFPVSKIGLTMMAVPVSLVVVSPLSGWLYDRIGSARLISTTGLAVSSLAVVLLIRLTAHSSVGEIVWRLALLGAGQSIFLSPNSASVLNRVTERYAGLTAGILATARNFGMLSGAAAAGGSFAFFFGHYSGSRNLHEIGASQLGFFMQALQGTLAIALLLLLLGCGISLLRR